MRFRAGQFDIPIDPRKIMAWEVDDLVVSLSDELQFVFSAGNVEEALALFYLLSDVVAELDHPQLEDK